MKWAFSSVGLVVAGLVGIVILLLFQNITVNNEHDYYLLKEVTEAAMLDSIDLAYYRDTGELKIVQEKFVENFTRRFAETANAISITDYNIEFYDIMEKPPKVSILIKTGLGNYTIYGNSDDYNIANQLDAILEADDSNMPGNSGGRPGRPGDNGVPDDDDDGDGGCEEITKRYYSVRYGYTWQTLDYLDEELVDPEEQMASRGKYKIKSVNYLRRILHREELFYYKENFRSWYGRNFSDTSIGNRSDTKNEHISMSMSDFDIRHSDYKVGWKASYVCNQLKVFGNDVDGHGRCLTGIVYDVLWVKNDERC